MNPRPECLQSSTLLVFQILIILRLTLEEKPHPSQHFIHQSTIYRLWENTHLRGFLVAKISHSLLYTKTLYAIPRLDSSHTTTATMLLTNFMYCHLGCQYLERWVNFRVARALWKAKHTHTRAKVGCGNLLYRGIPTGSDAFPRSNT